MPGTTPAFRDKWMGLHSCPHRLSTPRTTTKLQFYIHDVLNANTNSNTKKERDCTQELVWGPGTFEITGAQKKKKI